MRAGSASAWSGAPVSDNTLYVPAGTTTPVHISVKQGDTARVRVTLQADTAGTGSYTATSLASATWSVIVSDRPGGTAQYTGTTAADYTTYGVYVVSETAGQFTVVFTAAITAALTPNTYHWECVVTFPAGHGVFPSEVQTVLAGRFTVTEDAT